MGGAAFLPEKRGGFNSSMTKVIGQQSGDTDAWLAMGLSSTR